MEGRTLLDSASPITQSIDAVKSLLAYVGRASDPLPTFLELPETSLHTGPIEQERRLLYRDPKSVQLSVRDVQARATLQTSKKVLPRRSSCAQQRFA